ncbi:MAG: hypothetical protein H0T42_14225 [Deltaproteobacteria bacterium]|nr:hypothetical protein [Deltaproteobacteria bacterium]
MSRSLRRSFMLLCSMGVAACGDDGSGIPCTEDAQCPSQFCRADGTCAPADIDAPLGPDAPTDAPSGVCTPNHDGAITLAELPLTAGKMATFRVALDPTFDTAGSAATGGARRWDLTAQLAMDSDRPLALLSPIGTWWATKFPTASYAALLSAESDLLGVFQVDATALVLLGVVSPAAGAFRTELAYDPPAKILALPVATAGTWATTSTVSGTAQGALVSYTERYASLVDQVGTMATPYGEFPVVRVATDLTRSSFGSTLLTKRSFAWVAECFGSIATVQSQDFESSAEFTDPAEVRRLAP